MLNINKCTKTKPKPKPTLIFKNCSYVSAYHCAQLSYTAQHRTVLIIFLLSFRQREDKAVTKTSSHRRRRYDETVTFLGVRNVWIKSATVWTVWTVKQKLDGRQQSPSQFTSTTRRRSTFCRVGGANWALYAIIVKTSQLKTVCQDDNGYISPLKQQKLKSWYYLAAHHKCTLSMCWQVITPLWFLLS